MFLPENGSRHYHTLLTSPHRTMAELNENTSAFTSQDGLSIFYRFYPADGELARLVIAHGLGEHSGRYHNVVKAMVSQSISVWAADHRGHGQSGGPRGHVSSFQDYINDLQQIIVISRQETPSSIKTFLLGHSMGGLIALNYAAQYPDMIQGLILSSPALGMKVKVPPFKQAVGKIMSYIWPGLTLANELDSSKISRDTGVVAAYNQDPLVHNKVTARWFTEFLEALRNAIRLAPDIRIPVLMQIAGNDHLVDSEASRLFFSRLPGENKTFQLYNGLFHEVYNETEADRVKVLGELKEWITARLKP
jgi:alpha-beta hydrolase superfamily lysophospholipase